MPFLDLPWDSQPQETVELSDHPSARGVIGLWNAGAGPTGAVGGSLTPYTGGAGIAVSQGGLAFAGDGTSNGRWSLPDLSSLITTEATLLLLVAPKSTASQGFAYFSTSTNTTNSDHYPYSGLIYSSIFKADRWVNGVSPQIPFTDMPPHCVTVQFKNGSQRYAQGGRTVVTASYAVNPVIPSNARLLVSESMGQIYLGSFPLVVLWNRYLPDDEINALARDVVEPYQLFAPRSIWVPAFVGGGSGTTISATVGNAVASGVTATVDQQRTIAATPANATAAGITAQIDQKRTVGATPGNAIAAGVSAAIDQKRVIAATPGNAVANGVTASVSNGSDVVISVTPGNAVADGIAATIDQKRSIAATPGNAVANGIAATITNSNDVTIGATPGNAVAYGVQAFVRQDVTIRCAPGNAVADGVLASINGVNQAAGSMGFSMSRSPSRMRRLVTIQFRGKLYQALEEDIPELIETLEEQAEQVLQKKRNARSKPAPKAAIVSAPSDVLPSLQARIADVNAAIGALWKTEDDDEEEEALIWLML